MNEYERSQSKAIAKWKKEEPRVASKAVGYLLGPVMWGIEKIVPVSAIEAAMEAADWLACKTIPVPSADGRGRSLEECDNEANEVHDWAIGYAVSEGGVTGAGGLLGIAVDVPFVVTLSLRTVRRIGQSYGYSVNSSTEDFEKKFALSVLGAATANTMGEKIIALGTLQSIRVAIIKQTWKKMSETAAEQVIGREAFIVAIRSLAKQLGVNLTKRKALQIVPLVGAGVGAAINGSFMKDIGWAARRSYQDRWLNERYGQQSGRE